MDNVGAKTLETAPVAPLAHRIPDACQRIGLGRSSLYELIKSGHLRTVRIGGRTLIPESELQRLVDDAKAAQA